MKTRIIPAIDIIGGRCVRLSQGDYERCTVYDADPADMVRRFVDAGMERIHAVDLDGAKASEPQNLRTLEKLASVSGATIEWGGGIKSEQALTDSFNAGASFAVIGSLAAREPERMAEWTVRYGSDRMVLGADAADGKIAVSGWLEKTSLTIDELIDRLKPSGLTQTICTEISRDGMLEGPDFDLYAGLLERHPDIIFTASGGVGTMTDIEKLSELGVQRTIVGKALYEGHVTLRQITQYILSC